MFICARVHIEQTGGWLVEHGWWLRAVQQAALLRCAPARTSHLCLLRVRWHLCARNAARARASASAHGALSSPQGVSRRAPGWTNCRLLFVCLLFWRATLCSHSSRGHRQSKEWTFYHRYINVDDRTLRSMGENQTCAECGTRRWRSGCSRRSGWRGRAAYAWPLSAYAAPRQRRGIAHLLPLGCGEAALLLRARRAFRRRAYLDDLAAPAKIAFWHSFSRECLDQTVFLRDFLFHLTRMQ